MNSPLFPIFQFVVFIFSAIIHEVCHGLMALKLGDETAKRQGRLTLNPINHIDPIGSVLLPFLMIAAHSPVVFGWAKPVPYNPMALYKDFRYGPLKVALAGPFSNLALALIFGVIVRFTGPMLSETMLELLVSIVIINFLLFVFNLVPIPPLDGSKILITILPREYARRVEMIGFAGLLLIFALLFLFSWVIQDIALYLTMLITGVKIL